MPSLTLLGVSSPVILVSAVGLPEVSGVAAVPEFSVLGLHPVVLEVTSWAHTCSCWFKDLGCARVCCLLA